MMMNERSLNAIKLNVQRIYRNSLWLNDKTNNLEMNLLEDYIGQLFKTELCYATERLKSLFN